MTKQTRLLADELRALLRICETVTDQRDKLDLGDFTVDELRALPGIMPKLQTMLEARGEPAKRAHQKIDASASARKAWETRRAATTE